MRRTRDERGSALVTTGHSACYPCIRSLGARGVNTVVASPNKRQPEFLSRFCDERVVVPPQDEDLLAYRDALLDVAERPDVRTIVPTREEDSYLLSRYADAFDRHVETVVPSMASLRSAQDRLRLFEVARDAGVPVPETRRLTDVDDWSPRLIVKSRYNLLTADCIDSYGEAESDLVKHIEYLPPGETPDVDDIVRKMGHVPIAQEFIPASGEYVFAALYDDGEPLATCQLRQIRCGSYVGGGGVYRTSVSIPELEAAGRTLLGALEWNGLACVEYMRDERTGEFQLAEINPRMWQSLASTVATGADFPYYYWLRATGRESEIEPGYDVGVGTHMLEGELSYLLSVLRDDSPHVERPSMAASVRDVVWSCVREPKFDYLRLDDPLPFLRSAARVLPSKR